jgi:hypothetical protein
VKRYSLVPVFMRLYLFNCITAQHLWSKYALYNNLSFWTLSLVLVLFKTTFRRLNFVSVLRQNACSVWPNRQSKSLSLNNRRNT